MTVLLSFLCDEIGMGKSAYIYWLNLFQQFSVQKLQYAFYCAARTAITLAVAGVCGERKK